MCWITLRLLKKDMSQRNIKIHKAAAAKVHSLFLSCTENYTNLCVLQLIMASKNPHGIAYMSHDYARGIHSKAIPSNPNFIRIAITYSKIEQWCKCHYLSFVTIGNGSASFNPADARSHIVLADEKRDNEIEGEKRLTAIKNRLAGGSIGAVGDAAGRPIAKSEGILWEVLVYVLGAFVLVLG